MARRAPQRPSDLAVEFFHLLPYRTHVHTVLFSSTPPFDFFSFPFVSFATLDRERASDLSAQVRSHNPRSRQILKSPGL